MAQKYRFHKPKDVKYTTNENTNAQQSICKNSYVAHQKFCSLCRMAKTITSYPSYTLMRSLHPSLWIPYISLLASFHRHWQLNLHSFCKTINVFFLALATSQRTDTCPEPSFLVLWCFVFILQGICLQGSPGPYWKEEHWWFWQLLQQEWMVKSRRKLQKSKGKETRKLNLVLHRCLIYTLFFRQILGKFKWFRYLLTFVLAVTSFPRLDLDLPKFCPDGFKLRLFYQQLRWFTT